ncbi:sigma-70 family RNA polymerase sigma factor [Patescibacteria group bacterium]|nr:sigma-70 family RNA polymerase sigma factor [Patescibacteria group bacterium]
MIEGEKYYIEKAQRGDHEAFGVLYDHYLPQIYRFILFKVGSKAEAEDLTHEVFLSAWRTMPNYRMQGHPLSSWLYQIARNAVIDFYRTAKHHIQIEMVSEDSLQPVASGQDSLDRSLEMEQVKKCIAQLRPDYQDLIIMRFIEELPTAEIATVLGKSEGAVRLMQHRALNDLKAAYHTQTYGPPFHEA